MIKTTRLKHSNYFHIWFPIDSIVGIKAAVIKGKSESILVTLQDSIEGTIIVQTKYKHYANISVYNDDH